jgi:hypothetical protein
MRSAEDRVRRHGAASPPHFDTRGTPAVVVFDAHIVRSARQIGLPDLPPLPVVVGSVVDEKGTVDVQAESVVALSMERVIAVIRDVHHAIPSGRPVIAPHNQ